MKKIAIIHTTKATVDSLNKLIKENISDVEVINILDDSILNDMINNVNIDFVKERWISYATTASKLNVQAILSACSTVGEFAEEANELLNIPVYRIDDAMATVAVNSGSKILVMATLNTTLVPTIELIKKKSKLLKKEIEINTELVKEAYDLLINGNAEEHNKKIYESVLSQINHYDVIVLAQASMANAIVDIDQKNKSKILTSPVLGVQQLKSNLANLV